MELPGGTWRKAEDDDGRVGFQLIMTSPVSGPQNDARLSSRASDQALIWAASSDAALLLHNNLGVKNRSRTHGRGGRGEREATVELATEGGGGGRRCEGGGRAFAARCAAAVLLPPPTPMIVCPPALSRLSLPLSRVCVHARGEAGRRLAEERFSALPKEI